MNGRPAGVVVKTFLVQMLLCVLRVQTSSYKFVSLDLVNNGSKQLKFLRLAKKKLFSMNSNYAYTKFVVHFNYI